MLPTLRRMVVTLGLDDRRALVTGGGGGIGRATAVWLARAGCDVVIADKDSDGLAESVAAVVATGRRAAGVEIDLRRSGAADELIESTVDALGGVDVAVNNVGMLAGHDRARFADSDDEVFRDIVEQNLLLTAACCRAEARQLIGQGSGGVIVNVSSGESVRPALALAPYGAAKAAINHLTQTLAVELGPHGIHVVAVAPGTTLTPVVRAGLSRRLPRAARGIDPARTVERARRPRRADRRARVRAGCRCHRPARSR